MTELFINGQLIDSIDTDIALTLSSFKLDSLGARKGSYSNVFDLPKTNANKLLFENCEIVTSVTSIPYQLNPCQIFVDGKLIVDGSAVIRETKENYRIFISAGNSDFFKLIGSIKLKDVDLSEFDHIYNPVNVRQRRETNTGFVYPNIDYGFFEFITLSDFNNLLFNKHVYFQPSFWSKSIIEKAINDLGYNLTGDLIDALVYRNSVVLCKGPEASLNDSLAKYRLNADFGQLTGTTTEKINFALPAINDVNNLYQNDINAGQFVYRPNQESFADFLFEISFTGKVITNAPFYFQNTRFFIDLLIYDDFGNLILTLTRFERFENRRFGLFNVYRAPESGTIEVDVNFTFPSTSTDVQAFNSLMNQTSDLTTLRFGWQVRSEVSQRNLDRVKLENLEFEINQIPRQGTRLGSGVEINVRASEVLPQNETLADLIITLANIEGIIFQVDETTKTVRTSKIDRLINEKGNALDWSKKIDLTEEPETIYTIDNFAKRNLYRFAQDDKDKNLIANFGEGSINVLNSNIQSETVLFESKFALVPLSPTFQGELLFGKVFTGDKYTFDGFDYTLIEPLKVEEFKPRLAVLSEADSIINVIDAFPNEINYNVNPLVLDFERAINDNYNLVKSVLINTKVVRALFLLDLDDIVNLDFTRPVFVDYFGEYFYIESINQFKVNKRESCFVTLVRI